MADKVILEHVPVRVKDRRQMRAVFIGDSITHGVGDAENKGGWPGRLLQNARTRGQNFTLYNLGIRSDTSYGIARRWEAESAARLPGQVRAVYVFSFGLNDATLVENAYRVPLQHSLKTCREIMSKATAKGDVLWIGPTPIIDETQPLISSLGISQTKSNAATGKYNAHFEELATELGVPYLNLFTQLSETTHWPTELTDGVHPNAFGYDRIAYLVGEWEPWKRLFP